MSYVLIIGANSDIAKATAREYVRNGYDLYLAGRNILQQEEFKKDLERETNKQIKLIEFDVLDYETHQSFYDNLEKTPEGVISAVGYLGDQEKAQADFSEAQKIINTNYVGIVSILNVISNDFEKKGSGFIVGISSVAGDRGRKSNYMYGSAKAAMSSYLSGLRNRLNNSQVKVLTVKPGFVNTKMTEDMDLPKKLTAQPDEVARDIFKAQQKGKDILYTKWIWRWIMFIIKSIPEWKFKGMNT